MMFYRLQQPYSDEAYPEYGQSSWAEEYGTASWSDAFRRETIRCPVYPGHQRAGKRIGNLVIEMPARKLGDFVWTWYSDCLITDRALSLFEEKGFTGFKVNQVGVNPETERGEKLAPPPIVWELVVTGRGGDADPKSGIRRIYVCPHCGLTRYSSFRNGIIVDESAWDGSDFFTITGYQFIIVTERVKQLVARHSFTNCALIPTQDLQWKFGERPEDVYGIEGRSY